MVKKIRWEKLQLDEEKLNIDGSYIDKGYQGASIRDCNRDVLRVAHGISLGSSIDWVELDALYQEIKLARKCGVLINEN